MVIMCQNLIHNIFTGMTKALADRAAFFVIISYLCTNA